VTLHCHWYLHCTKKHVFSLGNDIDDSAADSFYDMLVVCISCKVLDSLIAITGQMQQGIWNDYSHKYWKNNTMSSRSDY
jgi:hypothetical protein